MASNTQYPLQVKIMYKRPLLTPCCPANAQPLRPPQNTQIEKTLKIGGHGHSCIMSKFIYYISIINENFCLISCIWRGHRGWALTGLCRAFLPIFGPDRKSLTLVNFLTGDPSYFLRLQNETRKNRDGGAGLALRR